MDKNNILKKIVGKIADTASKVGNSMINYATGGDYLGLGNDLNEKWSAPTGAERIPSKLELNLGLAKAQNKSLPLSLWADEAGTRLYQWGQSKNTRNQQINDFYKNNLGLSEQGKKDLAQTNTVHNADVLDYVRNIPVGFTSSFGMNWGGNNQQSVRKNININPAAPGKDKREILLHELTHYVDSKKAISTQKNFLNDLNSVMKDNPTFSNYIKARMSNYGGENNVAPTEIYSFVTEYLSKIKSGQAGAPLGFPKKLVKYFPHIEIPKGLLTN
jgi:hypothetical protein